MQSREHLVEKLVEYLASLKGRKGGGPMSAWADFDLTLPQVRTLFYLADGCCRMSIIAGHLGVEMPSATSMIDRLVVKGLVERGQDPADRRAVVCSLTPDGRDAVEKFWSLREARDSELAAALSTEELKVVVPAMRIMAEAVQRAGLADGVDARREFDREGARV